MYIDANQVSIRHGIFGRKVLNSIQKPEHRDKEPTQTDIDQLLVMFENDKFCDIYTYANFYRTNMNVMKYRCV